MKLLRIEIISANSTLLNGLDVTFRDSDTEGLAFEPLCLIGPNGAGKSQLLQAVAEIFQGLYAVVVPEEERAEANSDLQFILEYKIRPPRAHLYRHVRVSRCRRESGAIDLRLEIRRGSTWELVEFDSDSARSVLPSRVIGYTSGGNETLSLPFLISRSGYAEEVTNAALRSEGSPQTHDTRLLFIDYGTHLEVLVANLLFGTAPQRAGLLENARLGDLRSVRCIIRLGHSAAPKVKARTPDGRVRAGVHLTDELQKYVDQLQDCATCWNYQDKTRTYTFDFFVDRAGREAFSHYWESALSLYSAFHKLSMLNDLALQKPTRERVKKEAKSGSFASRLPEPPDEDKVFSFVQVKLTRAERSGVVDYVAMSDGEHQSAQMLGVLAMTSEPNALFLLDEPESHFNPQWRVRFLSDILTLPTSNGNRSTGRAREQECLMTTHAPFVPSDLPRRQVFIFNKNLAGEVTVRRPNIETFGAPFDDILEECFKVSPPMSQRPRDEIETLMASRSADSIEEAMGHLGASTEKLLLASRLHALRAK